MKLQNPDCVLTGFFVAPLVGAWIEMAFHSLAPELAYVAPLVGAWIEIPEDIAKRIKQKSLLSWERGLKLTGLEDSENERPSLLSWERGLK